MPNFYDFTLTGIDGTEMPLAFYQNKVVLVVNVASECGLTPQYSGLQALYEEYKDKGFTIIGIPCNQFGSQEPGSDSEIHSFCTTRFNIAFPMSTKLEVNGEGRHPLYTWLINKGEDIQWNFEKFLIDSQGNCIERFSPKTEPESKELRGKIAAALN